MLLAKRCDRARKRRLKRNARAALSCSPSLGTHIFLTFPGNPSSNLTHPRRQQNLFTMYKSCNCNNCESGPQLTLMTHLKINSGEKPLNTTNNCGEKSQNATNIKHRKISVKTSKRPRQIVRVAQSKLPSLVLAASLLRRAFSVW